MKTLFSFSRLARSGLLMICLLGISMLASASPPTNDSFRRHTFDTQLSFVPPAPPGIASVTPSLCFKQDVGSTPASPGLSTETLISLKGQVSQVVAQRVGTFTGILGGKFNIDANVFGGFALTKNGLTGGGSLTHSFKAADQLDIVVGVFVQGTLNKGIDGGFVFGGSVHF